MPQTGSATTMAEIARRCRLSKATVSRALSLPAERSPVKPRTRERILRVAQDLGYRPNWRARAFSRQKTHTVGLIISGLLPQHEAIPHQILEAFTRVLRGAGYHLAFVPIDGALDWRDLVFGGHVDACATLNDPAPEVVRAVSASDLPAVAMNTSRDTPLPVVTVDDFAGGRQVGRYLRELGHRRVAMYVNEDAVRHYSQAERLRGLEAGLRGGATGDGARGESVAGSGTGSGAGSGDDAETTVSFVRDSHDRAVSRLLGLRPWPTALMCYSHYEAMPMLKEFWERGIRVPRQMSMVAFNDVFPMDCTIPPMTTVSVPADQIGAEAARVLLRQIEDGAQAPPGAQVFAESLMIRRSCAAPGANGA